jgi:hypothetical protein
VQSPFVAKASKGREGSAPYGGVERVRTRAVGEEDDDGQWCFRRMWEFLKLASVHSRLNPIDSTSPRHGPRFTSTLEHGSETKAHRDGPPS